MPGPTDRNRYRRTGRLPVGAGIRTDPGPPGKAQQRDGGRVSGRPGNTAPDTLRPPQANRPGHAPNGHESALSRDRGTDGERPSNGKRRMPGREQGPEGEPDERRRKVQAAYCGQGQEYGKDGQTDPAGRTGDPDGKVDRRPPTGARARSSRYMGQKAQAAPQRTEFRNATGTGNTGPASRTGPRDMAQDPIARNAPLSGTTSSYVPGDLPASGDAGT